MLKELQVTWKFRLVLDLSMWSSRLRLQAIDRAVTQGAERVLQRLQCPTFVPVHCLLRPRKVGHSCAAPMLPRHYLR